MLQSARPVEKKELKIFRSKIILKLVRRYATLQSVVIYWAVYRFVITRIPLEVKKA
jgi:hypothetical protein